MKKLRVLDLFSGIGGFSLGLERTGGFETVAFCEIEEFPRRVLYKHWPDVPCYRDVRELTAAKLAADGIAVDVICGGFPCQDISLAGNGAGLDGERSGLWSEIARLVGELGPRYVIVENVAALLGRGLDRVLRDLAAVRYDAEWHCIPASALGAHHRRDRIWIVGYPSGAAGERDARGISGAQAPVGRARQQDGHLLDRPEHAGPGGGTGHVADAAPAVSKRSGAARARGNGLADGGAILADPASIGHSRQGVLTQWCRSEANGAREAAYALSGRQLGQWCVEPDVGRVANGVPDRAHRLKGLGNAVVPQIPELIGRAILASIEAESLAA